MKKIIFSLIISLTAMISFAQGGQRIGFVDTDYVLQNIPEYSDAQEELNILSEKYAAEINNLKTKIDVLRKKFDSESVLLTDDQKKKKEEEITTKETELRELQVKYFSPDGELFTKRSELVQPIQEKIFNAITKIAQTKNLAFVLDKASGTTILYGNEKYDISDDVLDEIGSVMQTVRREDRKKSTAATATGGSSKGNSDTSTSTRPAPGSKGKK